MTAATTDTLATLTAAVESAFCQWYGLDSWADDHSAAALARALDRGEFMRAFALAEDGISSWLPDDGTDDSQENRRDLRNLAIAVEDGDCDDAHAVAEWIAEAERLAELESGYVSERAEAAAELGREALAAVADGDWRTALTSIGRACEIEREFGDDPAWGPVLRAFEAAEPAEADEADDDDCDE